MANIIHFLFLYHIFTGIRAATSQNRTALVATSRHSLYVFGTLEVIQENPPPSGSQPVAFSRLDIGDRHVQSKEIRVKGTVRCIVDAQRTIKAEFNGEENYDYSSVRSVHIRKDKEKDDNSYGFITPRSYNNFMAYCTIYPISNIGEFPDIYILFHHNCTDDGEEMEERFNLSEFHGQQTSIVGTSLSFGHISHYQQLVTEFDQMALKVELFINSMHKISMLKDIIVQGFFGQRKLHLIGKLYNWDVVSMPLLSGFMQYNGTQEHIDNAPLFFDGQVVKTRWSDVSKGTRTDEYKDVELRLLLDGKVIVDGTISSGETFHLQSRVLKNKKGILVGLIDPTKLIVRIEHACDMNSDNKTETQEESFRLVGDVYDSVHHFRMVRI